MCKKSKAEAKVLKDRTKGLDSRGNVAVNTQAESSWATETLKDLATNQEAMALLKADLKRVYDGTKDKDLVTTKSAGKFHKGYERFFGKKGGGKKGADLPPEATPQPQDFVNLMLETQYDFKEAVDALNRNQKSEDVALWKSCRTREEFADRGRIQGRERRNSFVGPHAGITDHAFRQEETENFFTREVVHAKGTFEGDPKSKTYQRFVEQGAPFIGGVSGTMQGLAMAWEKDKPLAKIADDDEREEEIEKREKMAGVYMATLLAGGHHSASEMLFSAQSYGLFKDVPDPLKNYPAAMQALGERFEELGLPGGLSPKAGATWRAALAKMMAEVKKVGAVVADTYKDEDYGPDVEEEFESEVEQKLEDLFGDELADKLDEIATLTGDDEKEERFEVVGKAKGLIAEARHKLDLKLIQGLDENPFVPVSIRKTIEGALDQVSSLAR